MKTPTNYFS